MSTNIQRFQVFQARTYEVKDQPREWQKRGDILVVLSTMPLDYTARKPRDFYVPVEQVKELVWDDVKNLSIKELNDYFREYIISVEQIQKILTIAPEVSS